MSKPIYCPVCGARMIYDASYGEYSVDYDPPDRAMMAQALCPSCLLAGPCEYARTHRGAAIKAGRAMRAILSRVAKKRRDRSHGDQEK